MSRKLGVAALIWTVALFLSRLLGLVRDSVLGSTLGVGREADVYAAAFRIPDLLTYVVSGGALSIVFIPMFTRYLAEGQEERAWRAFSLVANFVLVLAAVLVPAVAVAMPWLCARSFPGFDPESMDKLVYLSRIVLPSQVFHLLSGLLGAALLSKDRHLVPAFAPLVYNGSIIAGGLAFGTAEGFAWGALVGSFLGPFLLPLFAALREGLKWRPSFDLGDPDLRSYLRGAFPIMLAFSLVGLDDFVWSHFASASAGDVATLNYAKTLMKVPIGVFGFAMGQAAYPTLSLLYFEGKRAEAWALLRSAILRSLVLAFASQAILTVAAPEAGTLVYTTNRIPAASMESLALCLAAFCLALGPWTVQTLIARGFYARGRTWLPTVWGSALLVLSLPLYQAGVNALGAPGLALASSAAVTVYAVALYLWLAREVREGAGVGVEVAKLLLATALAGAAGWWVREQLPGFGYGRAEAFVRLAALSAVIGSVFAGACLLLRVDEARILARSAFGAMRRR